MLHNLLKISLLFFGLVILFFWSFSYQEQKKMNDFLNKISKSKVYHDPMIDEIYFDFLSLSRFNIDEQDVSIKQVKFPFVFNWMGMVDVESNSDLFHDAIGFASGMDDDSKIEIYLNHSDWNSMDYSSKKKLLYHELLHDCYNIEHTDNSCDIMYERLHSCSNEDLDNNLRSLVNQVRNR